MNAGKFCRRLLAGVLAFVIAVSPVTSGMQIYAEESQETSYYEDWNAAEAAVRAVCGIGDASKYTEVQVDLIRIFLNEWGTKAYEATTKEEADAVLADALEAYKALKVHDSAAMAEYAELMKVREATNDECMAVLEANIENIGYSKVSRKAYERKAREWLSALSIATTYERIEECVAEFEACSEMLVEHSPEIIAAKEEAKLQIREIIEEEFESCFAEDSYDQSVNDADTLEEINQAVEDARADMLSSVNKDTNRYAGKKVARLLELMAEYETELSAADYDALEDYIWKSRFPNLMYDAGDKAGVDAVYEESLAAIVAKIEDLKNTPDAPENPEIVLEAVSFHKTEVTIGVGQTADLTVLLTPEDFKVSKAIISPGDNSVVGVMSYNGSDGSWRVKVTAKKAGVAVVTCEVEGVIASCTVTVTEELQEIKADKVTLDTTSLSMIVGDVTQLFATIEPENVTDPTIVWEMEDPTIVSVAEDGSVTALKAGTTTVTAKCGEAVSEICEIAVREVFQSGITRISGATRYETSLKIADVYKEQLGVEKFRTVVVADGRNFPDALAGSYFAAKNNAPILMVNEKNMETVKTYIRNNVGRGGAIYILGGESAVPEGFEYNMAGYYMERLSGTTRYETNLEILNAAGVADEPILVCTGTDFADSLSASAAGYPILLVGKKGLTDAQLDFLQEHRENPCYIIGGTGAVSAAVEKQIKEDMNVKRISGKTRYETSVKLAEEFFDSPKAAVFAYAMNFPDGLCGGPLAMSLEAPLILTRTGKEEAAENYVSTKNPEKGIVLGGASLISDETIKGIYGLSDDAVIAIK